MKLELDAMDARILEILQDDARSTLAEIGRGWSKTSRPIQLELADSYAQFAEIHLCQSGIVR